MAFLSLFGAAFAQEVSDISARRIPPPISIFDGKKLDLDLSSSFAFTRMDATDSLGTTGMILSKGMNPMLSAAVRIDWPKKMESFLSFNGTYTALNANSANDTFSGAENFLWELALGTQKQFSDVFSLSGALLFSPRLFITRPSPAQLKMERTTLVDFLASANYRAFFTGEYEAGPDVTLALLLPGATPSLTVNTGFLYRVGLYGKMNDDELPLTVRIYYGDRIQSTSLTRWDTKELGFSISTKMNLMGGS